MNIVSFAKRLAVVVGLLGLSSSAQAQDFTELGFGWNSLSHGPSPDGGRYTSAPFLRGSVGQTVNEVLRLRFDADMLFFLLKTEQTFPCPSYGCGAPRDDYHVRGSAGLTENALLSLDPRHATYLIGGVGVYDTNASGNSLHLGASAGLGVHLPSESKRAQFSLEATWHRLTPQDAGPSWFVPVGLAMRF